jgi:hypothetical protein
VTEGEKKALERFASERAMRQTYERALKGIISLANDATIEQWQRIQIMKSEARRALEAGSMR